MRFGGEDLAKRVGGEFDEERYTHVDCCFDAAVSGRQWLGL
ncbi:hypothetical protein [Pseudovibrio sp. Ad13]|nr:hypothetical protein [Pseudovibrio sp. Ad13]